MRPKPEDALNRWLAAERIDSSESSEIADAALREMFEALPLLAPAAGFAGRVLARTGLQPAKRDAFAALGLRLALAASLVALSLGAIWLPPVLRTLGGLVSLSEVVALGVRGMAETGRGLVLVLRLGEWLFSFGQALSGLLLEPRALAALGTCLLVSGLAFRSLRAHISGERSFRYVDPI